MRVRVGLAALVMLALALAGCPGQGAAPGRGSASDEPGQASGATPPAADAPLATPTAAQPLPDGLVLVAEPGRDGVALVIQNRSERVVQLALEASVERVAGAPSAAAPAAEGLRLDCAEAAPRCLSLVPGAELRPAVWPAAQARAQCGSGPRAAAATGSYRFGVRGCGPAAAAGTRTSAPFELP